MTRHSTTGYIVLLEMVAILVKSAGQKSVALSVTEAELMAAVACAQDMLYTMRILESMGLQVEKPMILQVDNSGAVDIANNWSVSNRTRHVDTRLHFLREMKEQGIIKTVWVSGELNAADMFTKNLPGPLFNTHVKSVCGEDKYGQSNAQDREGVGS